MSQISVDPVSIMTYADSAQKCFTSMQTSLGQLVKDVVGVQYEGGNAFTFKTEAGNIATQFANSMSADIGVIAQAINTSTGNILVSLGNDPVAIKVSTETFVAPAPSAKAQTVDVETDGLETLITTVTARFEAINAEITANQAALEGTHWVGAAKSNAVAQVTGFSDAALKKSASAQESLVNYINRQIQSVVAADR